MFTHTQKRTKKIWQHLLYALTAIWLIAMSSGSYATMKGSGRCVFRLGGEVKSFEYYGRSKVKNKYDPIKTYREHKSALSLDECVDLAKKTWLGRIHSFGKKTERDRGIRTSYKISTKVLSVEVWFYPEDSDKNDFEYEYIN